MLAEYMIRLGKVIEDNHYAVGDRIDLLTDVHSENCKNYFQNVFVAEMADDHLKVFRLTIGDMVKDGKKETFKVNQDWSISFPVIYPNGGNPLHAQGVYPIPCYLLYDPHIKSFREPQTFVQEFLLPRLHSTVSYQETSPEQREQMAERIAQALSDHADRWVSEDKQLGILMIVDHRLGIYSKSPERLQDSAMRWIATSRLFPECELHLDGQLALQSIVEAKFMEAASLGELKDAVSTFTNRMTDQVVSIYNKSWLWLSPTWDMPKSIHWKDDEWTKGIKMDRGSYAAFLYGTQFLKKITVPVASAVLKEMFAPLDSAEAKTHMKATSIEQIFGAPIALPLLDRSYGLAFYVIRDLLANVEQQSKSALHLKVVAGMDLELPIKGEGAEEYRLTLLYYSGDLSRGNMHIRAMIEDVVPSVAAQIQQIVENLVDVDFGELKQMFGLKSEYTSPRLETRIKTLPALLGNAYGSGYVWHALQKTLHREDLTADRLTRYTAIKLNELANKQDYWGMKQELVFYFSFLQFLGKYRIQVQNKGKGVKDLSEWQDVIEKYHRSEMDDQMMKSPENLGFATGMLLKQFENSYHRKTGKEFIRNRVTRFGSRLSPEIIWVEGVLQAAELEKKWTLNLSSSFYSNLAEVSKGFVHAKKENLLVTDRDLIITAFWAGYLSYVNPNKSNDQKEEATHVHS